MGSMLANALPAYFETNCLQIGPCNLKTRYLRHVDYIFVLFTSPEHLEAFQNFLNSRHANMSFTIENEKQNRMSFLHVQIIGEDKTLTTSFYHKPTFGGVYTHFDSFLPSTYKFGIIYTLAYKFFEICSSWTKLHTELFFRKCLP